MTPPDAAEENDDEAALLVRCRRGDTRAWDALFDRHYAAVARFVHGLGADFADAEEICQDTFLAVIRHLDRFDGRSRFGTWLLRIAANKARDHRDRLRAAKRGGGVTPISLNHDGQDGADRDGEGRRPPDPPCPRPGPDAVLLGHEDAARLRACLDELGDPCREILELRYFADLSYEEIAAELRLNVKTVSSRLSKCLDRLGTVVRRASSVAAAVARPSSPTGMLNRHASSPAETAPSSFPRSPDAR